MNVLSLLSFVLFGGGMWASGFTNVCKYTIDEKPSVRVDEHLQGIWKLAEDTDAHNFLVIERKNDFEYSVTYMNRGGSNRGLEHFQAMTAEVNGVKFLEMVNWDFDNDGYIFFRLDEVTKGSWDVTARRVTDPQMKEVKSRAELRKLLEKNLNNATFYGKPQHFRKKFEFNSFK